MARELLETSRKRLRRRFLIKLVSWFFLAVLAGGSFAAFFYIPSLAITSVSFSGTEAADEIFLRGEIFNILGQKYFSLLPKNNLIFLPKEELELFLAGIPRLESFSIERKFPSRLNITIRERKPFAIWCQGGQCAWFDHSGFIFAPAPYFSGSAILKVEDERGKNFFGSNFLPPETLERINLFAQSLRKNFGEEMSRLVIKNDALFHLVLKSGWYLIAGPELDQEKTAENLGLVLEELGDKKQNLEYIDLRFSDKVFYRFRESGR